MTVGGQGITLPPDMARLHPHYEPRHHLILLRAISRREVHPKHLHRFCDTITPNLVTGNPMNIDVQALIDIANRIGSAETGMDSAQAVITNAQAAKQAAQSAAQALIDKASADVTAATASLAAAQADYHKANADLLAFVQAIPPDPTPSGGANATVAGGSGGPPTAGAAS